MNNDVYAKRVRDIMSTDVVSVHPDETLHGALELMSENRVAALPVVDRRDHCVGILSTSDLVDINRDLDEDLDALQDADAAARGWLVQKLGDSLGHEKVVGLMSDNVAAVGPEAPLAEAAREMLRNRVHRLPVVDETGRMVGILSTMDLLTALVAGAPLPAATK